MMRKLLVVLVFFGLLFGAYEAGKAEHSVNFRLTEEVQSKAALDPRLAETLIILDTDKITTTVTVFGSVMMKSSDFSENSDFGAAFLIVAMRYTGTLLVVQLSSEMDSLAKRLKPGEELEIKGLPLTYLRVGSRDSASVPTMMAYSIRRVS